MFEPLHLALLVGYSSARRSDVHIEVAGSIMAAQRMRHARITDLPADILLIIAREVLSLAWRPAVEPGHSEWEHVVRLDPWCSFFDADRSRINWSAVHAYQDLLGSLFPSWRVAMSPISSLWTHLVIWTGRDPTPLDEISEYLSWSRDKPLDIFILRRYDPSLEDRTEKACVQAVVELLLPHMQRWHVLCMKVLHSSSLPIPHVDITGQAKYLEELFLDFVVDDLTESQTSIPITGLFDTPALKRLSMGGVHFRDAYVKPGWKPMLLPFLTFLAIDDYRSCNGPFPFIDLLTCLTGISHGYMLKLENLQLDCSYTGPPLPHTHRVTSEDWEPPIKFVGMDAEALVHYYLLLEWTWSTDISYVLCKTPIPPGARLAPAMDIHISDTHDPDVLLSILRATSCRDCDCGDGLWLRRCDCLRAVFPELARPIITSPDVATDPFAPSWLFPDLTYLLIQDCTQFSSADLRALVQARAAAGGIAELEHQNGQELAIEVGVASLLMLRVKNCCELAPEDKEWFDANLKVVSWDGWTGGCGTTP